MNVAHVVEEAKHVAVQCDRMDHALCPYTDTPHTHILYINREGTVVAASFLTIVVKFLINHELFHWETYTKKS